jgi:hypothetical protein
MALLHQTRRICVVAEQPVNNPISIKLGVLERKELTSNIAWDRPGSDAAAGARQAKPGVVGFQ